MARTLIHLIFAVVVSLILPAAASTEPIRWEFRGAIAEVRYGNAEMRELFPLGGEAIFSVTIDPEAAVPCTSFTQGCYHYQWSEVWEFTFEASIAGHNYFFPNLEGAFSNERVTVHPDTAQLGFDNSLSEHLSGEIVGTAPAFRPHALDFHLRWPGVTFDSYDIPRILPTSPVEGGFHLYLWTCRDVANPGCVRQDTQVMGHLTSAVQVPEPMTLATVGLGLFALVIFRRLALRTH